MEQSARADLIETVIDALDLPQTEDAALHVGVMLDALAIYGEKDRRYGSAWKRFGALNNLVRTAAKAERLVEVYWQQRNYVQPDEDGPVETYDLDLDDAYDLINYDAFFVVQARQGRWTRG